MQLLFFHDHRPIQRDIPDQMSTTPQIPSQIRPDHPNIEMIQKIERQENNGYNAFIPIRQGTSHNAVDDERMMRSVWVFQCRLLK